MYITNEIKKQLIANFPPIELSYEKLLHKKVPADMYMLIPKGIKVFVWITTWQTEKVCLVISNHYNNNNVADTKIYIYPCQISGECAMGTILYGTLFDYKGIKHFTIEDIFYYKGQPIIKNNTIKNNNTIKKTFLEKKIELFKDLFFNKHIEQKIKNQKQLIIGLPFMCTKLEEAFQQASQLPYVVYSIQLHINNNNNKHKIGAYLVKNGLPEDISSAALVPVLVSAPAVLVPIIKTNHNQPIILKVKATLEDDIYNLYCIDTQKNNIEKCIGIAMISTYKASVMMNKLFRKIRENDNLDLLEESDEEDDFENINEDKYVDLEKSILMYCIYSKRFKRWQPISVYKEKEKEKDIIISYTDLKKKQY